MAFTTELVAAIGGGGPIDARVLRSGAGGDQSFSVSLPAGTWFITSLVRAVNTATTVSGSPALSIAGSEVAALPGVNSSIPPGYVTITHILTWAGGNVDFSLSHVDGQFRHVTAIKIA